MEIKRREVYKIGEQYAYIRVSSRDQNEERQLIAMQELCIPERNIYIDKQSGKDFKRPQYKRLARCIKKDDLLYICLLYTSSSAWPPPNISRNVCPK